MQRVRRLSAQVTAASALPGVEIIEDEVEDISPDYLPPQPTIVQDMFGPLKTGLSPDLRPIKFDPSTADLKPGGLMPALDKTKQQRVHEYYRDKTGQVSAGLWEVKGAIDGMTFPTEGRSVHLMLLPLTNSPVQVENLDSPAQPISAMPGEAIVIPEGARCTWTQEEGAFVMIGYVYFQPKDAPVPPPAEKEKKPKVARLASLEMLTDDTELKDMKDVSRYIDQVPTHHVKGISADATKQFSTGLWDAGPAMHTRPLPFPGNPPCPEGMIEYSCILEGECTITNGDGIITHIKPGESYLVPRGMSYEWHSDGYVAKIAANFRPRIPKLK